MTHRRHFGSVRKRSSGRYQASYWHAGVLHTAPTTYPAKADALAYLATVEADIRRGGWIDPHAGDETLRSYANRWLDGRTNLRPGTQAMYRYTLDRYILDTPEKLGDKSLAALKPTTIRNWHASLASQYQSTAAKAYRLLSSICRAAVSDELILRSPCRVQGAGVEHASERPSLSISEVGALTDAMPDRLRLVVLVGVWCSLRRGELLALRRRDIDVLGRAVRVERSVQYLKGASITYGPPKTAAGVRTVHYPDVIADAIADHLERHVGPGPDSLLFTGEQGGPLSPAMLQKTWDKARTSVGRTDLHLHDLRHAGATLAAITGATTKELMTRLGHSSSRAALIYQHATADRDKALAAALSELARPAAVVPIKAASR
jgi:integrase